MSPWGRSRGDRGGWYPQRRARRAAPEHGIKVKKIGATWWGKLWVEALERTESGYSNRLGRGATYARTGRVHDLEVRAGQVVAKVTGTRLYKVSLTVAPLPDAAWDAAILAMSAQAVFSAELLAGQMPPKIDEAFAAAKASLFPAQESDLVTECSCPDYANPCKHVAAVHYVLGEAFDGDPFLLFELRGRSKAQVLAGIRRARGDGGTPARGTPATSSPENVGTVPFTAVSDADYERPRGDLGAIRFHLADPVSHAAVVRGLGPPPKWTLEEPLADLLAAAYGAAASLARGLAEPRPDEPQD